MPTREQIREVFDVDAAYRELLGVLEPEDMLKFLSDAPAETRKFLLNSLGLGAARQFSRAAATQVIARMAAGGARRDALLADLFAPQVWPFGAALSAQQWAALLGPDPRAAAAVMLDSAPVLALGDMAWAWAGELGALEKVGLIAAADAGLSGSAIALAFLADQDEQVAKAYTKLTEEYPALPAPCSPSDISIMARLTQAGKPSPLDMSITSMRAALEEIAVRPPVDLAEHLDALERQIAEALPAAGEAVRDGWERAAALVVEQGEALGRGQLPDAGALQWAARFADLTARVAGELTVADRDSLVKALDALREQNDVNPARAWLRRLAQMVGPAELSDEIEQVAAMAAEAAELDEHDLDGALHALLTLIDLADAIVAGGIPDVEALFHAQETARNGLPEHGRLIYSASTGSVLVPKPESVDGEDIGDGEVTHDLDGGAAGVNPDGVVDDEIADVDDEAADVDDDLDDGDELAQDSLSVGIDPKDLSAGDVQDLAADEQGTAGLESQQTGAPGPVANSEQVNEHANQPALATPDEQAPPLDGGPGASVTFDEAPDAQDDEVDLAALLAASRTGALRRYSKDADTPATPEPATATDTADQDREPLSDARDVDIRPTWGQDAVAGIDQNLLAAGRFGLAADVAELTGAPQASVAARQLAAHSQNVRTATGAMATAFSERARRVVREDLRDDRAGQLIAWAAAAKMAVLAPPAGASDTLLNLAPCIESSPSLLEVGEAFIEAARGGVVVVAPEAVRATGALATAQQRVRDLSAKAEDILTTSRHRNIKYIPANEVFQRWISSNGLLGPALAAVRDNDSDKAASISQLIVDDLHGRGERAIESVFRTFANRSVKTITAGPRRQLLDRWDEAVTLCSQWAAACEQITALQAAARNDSWQSSALARLRARIEPHRETALADLAAEEQAVGIEGDNAAGALLADAFAACDDGVPEGEEPTRAFAEHNELLALPAALDVRTLQLVHPEENVHAVLELAADGELSADEVYELLAARAAHDLTAVLVAGTRALDPVDGARLEAQRNRDVPGVDLQVREEVASLRSNIDVRRLAGALSDMTWSSASARVAQLADPARRDYESIRATIADLTAELDAERSERIADTRARIAAAVAEHENVAKHYDHLVALCEAGQISTAEEELQQALEGATITRRGSEPEHLLRFFPAVPDILSRHSNALDQFAHALKNDAGNAASTPVTAELAAVGIDVSTLSPSRVEQAGRAIGGWRRLASKAAVAGMSEQDAVGHVLRQAGLEFGGHSFDKGGNRAKQWLTLTKVRGDGKALTPVLGSGMSPGETHSLRVLLVRQAPSPATVIEWMSGEVEDRTVLVLWLASSALTAADWRAIGEASRGRKNPPVVMFDLGTLVYLCSQAEPRRTTLASIALPFTSASPYRDTHGEAAPEMFFGRTQERSQIIDMRGSSFVSGGRQLGKTTLLQHAARRFSHLSEHHVAVYRSLYHVGKPTEGVIDPPERVWNELWPALVEHEILPPNVPAQDLADAVCNHVKSWLAADDRRQLLILLDETDDFLDADSQHARFLNVGRFRDLMLDSGRRVKVVLAGLHRTARFESLPNQPLSHLGQPITVGPLRPQHAFELLTEPMAAMGYTFDSEMTVARALATANNMPAQLQLLGASLVEHMSSKALSPDGPPTVITAADVEEAFDQRLQDLFREKFTLTLTLDPRYKVIAYVVAHIAHENGVDASLTLSELSDECRSAWPEGFAEVSADMFRGLVNECVDLGVLAPDGTRFRLRTPTVLRLLGTDVEVFDELADASSKLAVPTVSDAGAFRPRLDDQHHGALTTRQIGALLKPEAAVTVVAGADACGLRLAVSSLEHAAADVPQLSVSRSSARDLALAAAIAKAAGRTWLIVDARTQSAQEVAKVLDVARAATGQTRQPVRTIVVAGPSSAPAWATWPDRVDLTRFEPQGLAMHADVNNLPFYEPAKIAELLAVTGGWPALVDKVTAAAHDPSTRTDAQGLMSLVSDELQIHPGALARSVGVSAQTNPALHLAFTHAMGFTGDGPEPMEELAEILDSDSPSRATLRDAGFADARSALEALVALGALVPDSEGRLSAQGVLRADVERAG